MNRAFPISVLAGEEWGHLALDDLMLGHRPAAQVRACWEASEAACNHKLAV